MNAKEIIDKSKLIVKRSDFDRELALFLLNTIVKDVVRDNRLPMFDTLNNLTYNVYGEISIKANSIKNIVNLEYVNENAERKFLRKIKDYEAARYNFDFTTVGEPSYYVIMGDIIKILPVPETGTISVYAELYPSDLIDNVSSTSTITEDIGNALVYLLAGEYFDMLQEEDRGKYWKNKGAELLRKYLSYIKNVQVQNINVMYRDPFGNLTYVADGLYNKDADDYDMGTFR